MDILFRGKKESNGEWVQGYFRKRQIVWGDKEYPKRIIEYLISWYSSEMSRWFEVKADKHTISQCTNFEDKYDNKLWEGDITALEYNDGTRGCYQLIVRNPNSCCLEKINLPITEWNKNDYMRIDGQFFKKNCVIIGNKWDNPELLEGENEI